MPVLRLIVFCAASILMLGPALPSAAHVFWIEPHDFRLAPGGDLDADLRIGDDFPGERFGYWPSLFLRFEQLDAEGEHAIRGRKGARPAVRSEAAGPGLTRLIYHSRPTELVWDDFERFQEYLAKEGLETVLDQHRMRGLPDSGFKELFSRNAKSLVGVAEGSGSDKPVGLPLEFVLNDNPYTGAPSNPLGARLLWQGEPLAGALVRILRRTPEGEAHAIEMRTDAEGKIALPPGPGVFVLNSVHMTEPDAALAEETGAAWHSIWGSLSFARGAPALGDQ